MQPGSNSQNFVKHMQCFAVVIFTAFESNHTADTRLPSFWPIKTRNSHSLCSNVHSLAQISFRAVHSKKDFAS